MKLFDYIKHVLFFGHCWECYNSFVMVDGVMKFRHKHKCQVCGKTRQLLYCKK